MLLRFSFYFRLHDILLIFWTLADIFFWILLKFYRTAELLLHRYWTVTVLLLAYFLAIGILSYFVYNFFFLILILFLGVLL